LFAPFAYRNSNTATDVALLTAIIEMSESATR